MQRLFRFSLSQRDRSLSSFSLIELLVVMAIIAILAAFVLYAGVGVIKRGQRARATSEIAAMGSALDSFKTDNGIYPPYYNPGFVTNAPSYVSVDPSTAGSLYIVSSENLFYALSGQTNLVSTVTGVNKSYMTFRLNQLGNTTATAGTPGDGTTTYVKDPFGISYGYSTGTTTSTPYNGFGFFDLWSTGGTKGTTASNTNSWIYNW